MNLTEIMVEGTLQSDGTLHLDEKPNLSPGRVQVVLRQRTASESQSEDWWQFMQRTRRELEAAGSHFMNEEELDVHLEWLREDDRIDGLLQGVESPRHEEPA